MAYQGWATYRVYRDAPRRRARDVSTHGRPVPDSLRSWVGSLAALGYTRLGEVELELPALGPRDALRGRGAKRHTAWIFVDGRGTTSVSVMEGLVELSSQ